MTDPDAAVTELLLALAARCEAEGPSRELDTEIAHAMGCKMHDGPWVVVPSFVERDQEELRPCLHYSESLDCAVTLIPDVGFTDWGVSLRSRAFIGGAHVYRPAHYYETGKGRTPELALCAAALRARAAIASKDLGVSDTRPKGTAPPQGSAP